MAHNGAMQGQIRKREFLWMALAVGLAWAYLDQGVLNDFRVIESAVQERAECEKAKERSRQYATALVYLLNEKPVMVGDARVSCRVKEQS